MQKIDVEKDPLGMGKVIKRLGVNVTQAVVSSGEYIAEDIAGQGRLRAPIDEGDLRRSIYKEAGYALIEAGKKIVFWIRATALYAAIQHENEDFFHPKGGEDHYLTNPAEERKDKHQGLLQKNIAQAMRKTSVGA